MYKYQYSCNIGNPPDTFQDGELFIEGYNLYRRDRNAYGGGLAVYIQSHIPLKIRYDLMKHDRGDLVTSTYT